MASNNTKFSNAEIQADKSLLARNLKLIRDNNLHYADLSAQLQHPSTRSTWIELFKQRAAFSAKMYDENNRLNDQGRELCIKHYADGLRYYSNDLKYADLDRLSRNCFTFYYFKKIGHIIYMDRKHPSIPFILEEACKAYEAGFERLMPHSELTLLLYATELRMQFQISQLGDEHAYKNIVHYAYKILEFEPQYESLSHDFLKLLFRQTFRYLFDVRLVCADALSADEVIALWARYQRFKEKHPAMAMSGSYYQLLSETHYFISTFIPTYAINYHRTHDDSIHDSWLRAELIRYVDSYNEVRDPYTYQLYAFSKYLLKQWTINEAYENTIEHYGRTRWELADNPSIPALITTLLTSKQIGDMLIQTDYAPEVKQQRIRKATEVAIEQIKRCNSIRLDAELSNIICRFLNNPSVSPYMTPHMRLNFIRSIFRGVLVQTYAHCRMVARLCEEILDAVIIKRPELLVGYLGINHAEEVTEHAYELNDYIINAAMYHDIGKLTMIQIINNDHCRLMDHEFEILKEHPERGLRFLKLVPSLAIYHDAVIGHHKWYDGKGGYPASYDNTHSSYRIFVDILSIADCLEAATDNLGRNYSRKKEFADLFEEMYTQSGTRYNPDIMELIHSNPNLYETLSNLIHEGWEHNYYEVYLDYFDMR